MPKKRRKPRLTLHKATGQARVRIDGRDHYCGAWGSAEAQERYDDLIAEWLIRQDTERLTLTVDDLVVLYMEHVNEHYRKNGRPTSEVSCIKTAMRYLVVHAGRTRARQFGPKALKLVRSAMVGDGHCRLSINKHIGRIRRAFKWAVAEELLPQSVWRTLTSVDGLQAGRTKARESTPVRPVPQAAIDAIRPFVSPPIWAAVQVQLLTGMRPNEVLSMRGIDLNLQGRIWEYTPQEHKTEHLDRERSIFIGPRAQAVIREFLTTNLTAYVFRPRDVRSPKRGCTRQPGERYGRDAYRNAIQRAYAKAAMPEELRIVAGLSKEERAERRTLQREWMRKNCWHPHQLRHNAGTLIRREAGIDTARAVLGHSSVVVTEIYAEIDAAKARDVIARIG